jgi:hypothetical protein
MAGDADGLLNLRSKIISSNNEFLRVRREFRHAWGN